ncbi:hypothetical protein CHLRE_09g397002v5 [Chlamydomonas reinhardtii]|uniref:Uncharacterized protein n=1 Tax=Chlamydomonas reinhardtii TaxID=3055 RepID=A0A2K3DD40_CHLRE|nr:uncharacterized protein CHLRE_09g397002v5 [Chlamydomonas reinhardtii]PNW78449.1 hypothetical protein CHLRE_09g397002v5 [Chlamydomonas reinhardtii]
MSRTLTWTWPCTIVGARAPSPTGNLRDTRETSSTPAGAGQNPKPNGRDSCLSGQLATNGADRLPRW